MRAPSPSSSLARGLNAVLLAAVLLVATAHSVCAATAPAGAAADGWPSAAPGAQTAARQASDDAAPSSSTPAATRPVIADPTQPLDETDVWWDGATLATLSRSVVRLRPAGRGLLIDDAAAGVAPMAAGVLLKAGYDGTSAPAALNGTAAKAVALNGTAATALNATAARPPPSPLPRFIVTTWRAVNPGFSSYTVDTPDGASVTATLVRYDASRPIAVLALDAPDAAPPDVGAAVNAALDGVQVTDPTLHVGLLGEGEDGSPPPSSPATPPSAWVAFAGHVQDADAPLPRADGVPSSIRNVRCVVSRAMLARPRLGAGGGVFDASGRLIGLDLEDDLAVAGVSGFRPETHALTAAYVAAAVREAVTVWRQRSAAAGAGGGLVPPFPTPIVRRGDLGVTWHAVPVGTAVTHYRLPRRLAGLLTPPGYDGADGPGGPPRALIVGSVDAGAPATGVLRPGDVLLSVAAGTDGDAVVVGDDFLALDAVLTASLTTAGGADAGAARRPPSATLLVCRHGTPLTLTVPVADVEARATSRVATFGGCTFQDVSVAAARRYQLAPAGGGVLVTTCEGATGVPAGAGGGKEGKDAAYGGGAVTAASSETMQAAAAETMQAAAAGGGGLVDPSPLLTMLSRSADMQAPPLPAIIVGVGATPVAGLADFVAATRAAVDAARAAAARPTSPLPLAFAFTGVHVGCSRGYSMVDGAAVPADAAAVVEYASDARTGAWVKQSAAAPAVITPSASRPPLPDAAAMGDVDGDLPAVPADVVRRTPPRVGRAAAARRPPPPDDRDGGDAPVVGRRPGSAPGWPTMRGGGGQGGSVAGAVENGGESKEDRESGGEDGARVPAAVARPAARPSARPPTTLHSLLSLAARVLGRRTIQSSGVWSPDAVAAMKRAAVSVSMHEAVPLENYGPSPSSAGSGFLVDAAAGIIATNAHVAGAFAGGWEVTFFDGTVAEARSVWYSPQQDIAFLRVDPAVVPWPDAAVKLASWTSFPVDDVEGVADFSPVIAVGNPARFPFTAMQGVYVGPWYRTNEGIGGTRERNVLNWKAVVQSAGGASGSPVFNAAGAVVGALFAGGDTSDSRFSGSPWRSEAVMVAADYVRDALDDGVRALAWPPRGATGLELDLVPTSVARSFYGLAKADVDALKAAAAAAVPAVAAADGGGPAAPLRPRDRVIVVAGVEPGAPTAADVAAVVRPGDVLWSVGGRLLGGDLRAFERALHAVVKESQAKESRAMESQAKESQAKESRAKESQASVGENAARATSSPPPLPTVGAVPAVVVRRGAHVNVSLPVYDMTADRVVRYAAWAGAVFHDASDRTRYTYRVPTTPAGVFISYAANPSPWPRYEQQDARFTTKAMLYELDGAPIRGLADLVAAACRVQARAAAAAAPLPGTLVARNVQDDGAPGGDAMQAWWGAGLERVRLFEWDRAALVWRQAPDPCAV